jgi:hypothetical protein
MEFVPNPMAALSAVFQAYSQDPDRIRMEKDIGHISMQMQEYLSNYILIGYTVDGHAVNITYAPSPKDMDALNTGLHKYILDGPSRGSFNGGHF